MAIGIYTERQESPSWEVGKNSETRVRVMQCFGTPENVMNFYGPAIGSTYPGRNDLFLTKRRVEPVAGTDTANPRWLLYLTYEREVPVNMWTDGTVYELTLAGEAYHTTVDLDGNPIGPQEGKEPLGCDVQMPIANYVIQKHYDVFGDADVTNLMGLWGKVNQYAWKIWGAGEVRFEGASMRSKSGERVEVTYQFGIRPDGWRFSVQGWKVGIIGGKKMMVADGAAVAHRVYEEADFDDLGLGS